MHESGAAGNERAPILVANVRHSEFGLRHYPYAFPEPGALRDLPAGPHECPGGANGPKFADHLGCLCARTEWVCAIAMITHSRWGQRRASLCAWTTIEHRRDAWMG